MSCRAAHCMAGHLEILTSSRLREFRIIFLEERINMGAKKRRRKVAYLYIIFEKENHGLQLRIGDAEELRQICSVISNATKLGAKDPSSSSKPAEPLLRRV